MIDMMDLKFVGIYTRDRVCCRCRFFGPLMPPDGHMLVGLNAVCLWADEKRDSLPRYVTFRDNSGFHGVPPYSEDCPAFSPSDSVAEGDRIIDSSPELTQLMVTIRESDRQQLAEYKSTACEESGGPE